MVDIIEVDIIIIMDEDIDLDTIITMVIDTIMVVAIGHSQVIMDIIRIKLNIKTAIDITRRIKNMIKRISI